MFLPELLAKTLGKNNNVNMLRQIIGISVATASVIKKIQNTQTTASIEFLSGENWLMLDVTSGTSEFSEKAKITDAGVEYEQNIKTQIPCARIKKDMVLQLEQFHLFVKLTYNNGDEEMVGCPDFPVRLTADLNVKQSGYYKLGFTCSTIYKAFQLIT